MGVTFCALLMSNIIFVVIFTGISLFAKQLNLFQIFFVSLSIITHTHTHWVLELQTVSRTLNWNQNNENHIWMRNHQTGVFINQNRRQWNNIISTIEFNAFSDHLNFTRKKNLGLFSSFYMTFDQIIQISWIVSAEYPRIISRCAHWAVRYKNGISNTSACNLWIWEQLKRSEYRIKTYTNSIEDQPRSIQIHLTSEYSAV